MSLSIKERLLFLFQVGYVPTGISGASDTARDELLAEVEALEKQNQWQEISTAPKDGDRILVFTGCRAEYAVVEWDEDDKAFITDYLGKGGYQMVLSATHWQPLPSPPNDDLPPGLSQEPTTTPGEWVKDDSNEG